MADFLMNTSNPLIVAVAPNGARCSRAEHQAVPITPDELAQTAVDCLEAGATMIHLHVRDKDELHSLSPTDYKPAIQAVRAAVSDQMMIQVTSEAAGRYNADQQMALMLQLKPDFISLALREMIPSDALSSTLTKTFQEFLHRLTGEGCLIQYILYDTQDYQYYLNLLEAGVIKKGNHSLLFVLGRYTEHHPTVEIVDEYQDILSTKAPWMVCTFGPNSQQILSKTIALGCHVRIGFENGFYLPDGSIAKSNAELVQKSCLSLKQSGRSLADIHQTRTLLGQIEVF